MLNKTILKNNRQLNYNVQLLKSTFPGSRALVLDRAIAGLENIKVKDFYHVVIVQDDGALESVPEPDLQIYSSPSPNKDGLPYLDQYFGIEKTLFVVNYNAAIKLKKQNKKIDLISLNFLPSDSLPATDASVERTVACGLNAEHPGVHLAKIMGCTTIHYTGIAADTLNVAYADLQAFTIEKDKYYPKNIVIGARANLANLAL
jgi:hypothetical protein